MKQTTVVICSMLLVSIASAEFYEFDNYIEYDPSPTVSFPYPYKAAEPVRPHYNNNLRKTIVPASTEVIEVVEPAGIISTAISCTINTVKSLVVFFVNHVPGLIAGVAAALGLCKLTSLCDSQVTIYEAETELRSLASSERLSRAANFVKEALKKYNEMQKR